MNVVEIQKRALAAYRGGRHDATLEICEEGLRQLPDAHFLYFLKGSALMGLAPEAGPSVAEQGIDNLRVATVLAPAEASYHMALATALATLQRWPEALLSVRHCLRLKPDNDKAQSLCGSVLARLGQPAEAVQRLELLKASGKLSTRRKIAYAAALSAVGRQVDALSVLEELVSTSSADDHLSSAMGMSALALGEFEQGWDLYALRPGRDVHDAAFPYPRWNGESLAGKTILVHGEQGLGDELMFSSVIPDLLEEAANVIVACREPLVELFAASMPDAIVLPHLVSAAPADVTRHDIDFRCLMGDLPGFRRRSVGAFRGRGRYLDVPSEHVERLARVMRALTPTFDKRANVGLVWATGSSSSKNALQFARQKTVSPELLGSLAGLDHVQFFNLQNVNHAPQAADIPGLDVIDLAHHLPNFIDTAAALKNLSLLITVDTAQAHLAGAMGLPCWIMLPPAPDWRWGISDSTSYWYESVRLFRRGFGTTWADSLREVRQALEAASLPIKLRQ
jgi:hypothetical protein